MLLLPVLDCVLKFKKTKQFIIPCGKFEVLSLVKKLLCCVQCQGHNESSYVVECLSRQCLLNYLTFYSLKLFGDKSLWPKVLLSSRSGSQWGLILSKQDHFYCIFKAADSFTTKLSSIMHHHNLKCPVKRSFKVKNTVMVPNLIGILSVIFFCTTAIFATKLGVWLFCD